jgi:hypothetical protein
VIEFPPGSTVLIPSALFKHSNTSIQSDENRFSIIQYAAGALFRWVENKCRTQEEHLKKASEEEKQAYLFKQNARWAEAAAMYTTLDEISVNTPIATT